MISFARGIPGADLLPSEAFAAAAVRAAEKDGARALNYGPPSGYPPLREWVAERHDVDPARVELTTGSLQGFHFARPQPVDALLASLKARRTKRQRISGEIPH